MKKMHKIKGKFEVKMLGGFVALYDGKPIEFGKRNTSKFIQLLQIILLSGEEGIGKSQLFDALYGFEEMKNQNNSLNNLIYRLRKQLLENGFPVEECIVLDSSNHYGWNFEVPVELDVFQFEKLAKRAEAAPEAEQEELLKEAVGLYQGELLPAISNETWVITKSLELKKQFAWCIERLGELLKEKKEYLALYDIYTKASKIYPYDEWQGGQIDCLIFMERYQEAYRLYSDTVTLYLEEMGIIPSEEMMKKFRNLSSRVINAVENLDYIQKKIQETEEKAGAYFCIYPSFLDICQVILRSLERTGNTAYFMMCTIIDHKFKPVENEKKLDEMAAILQESIRKALRRGDFFTRYSKSQFLIVLRNIRKENCNVISDRINKVAEANGFRGNIYFHIAELGNVSFDDAQPPVMFYSGNKKK